MHGDGVRPGALPERGGRPRAQALAAVVGEGGQQRGGRAGGEGAGHGGGVGAEQPVQGRVAADGRAQPRGQGGRAAPGWKANK